ncbi:MAG: cyclic nucleotide-binding domain-containing protein, partial [Chthoniobacterales bacterium]
MVAAESYDAFRRFATNQLFAGIEPDVLEEIRYEMKTIRLNEGDVIFEEGERGDSLYLVGEGSIKISKTGRGGE